MRSIIIDPGHGGTADAGKSTYGGARGRGGTLEKDITLRLAQRVVHHLGEGAALTRGRDVNMSLAERIAVARRSDADVFLSLHVHDRADRGAESFVHPEAGAGLRRQAQALQRSVRRLGGAGGVHTGAMAVLSPSHHVPRTAACLLELDGLGDAEAERRLCDAAEIDRMGRAIAGGIREHLARPTFGTGELAAIRALAGRQIRDHGGIVVAMHVTSKTWGHTGTTDGYSTFRDHARQFALDHHAIGLAADAGGLSVGAGAAIEVKRPVAALLDYLAARLDLRDGDGNPVPMRVRMLALFTHGVERSVMADVVVREEEGHATYFTDDSVYSAFVDGIGRYASNDVRLLMFACRTAGKIHEGDKHKISRPYAEQLADEIATRLRAREGANAQVRAEVWGHQRTGHVTANHLLACVVNDMAREGRRRDDIHEFIATTFLRSTISTITGRDREGFAMFDAAEALETSALEQFARELSGKVRDDLDVDEDRDGVTDFPMVFNRDVSQVGLSRLFHALERDWYNDTDSGAELAEYLRTGTPEVRERFARGYSAVQAALAELFSEYWTRLVALAEAEGWSRPETPPRVAAKAAARTVARRERLQARKHRAEELARRHARQQASNH
jgi:hypothetical protein